MAVDAQPCNTSGTRTRCAASIHDVMPETLTHTERLLELLGTYGAETVTLLVVPGRNWTPQALATLRRFEAGGAELAGHGWMHRCEKPRTLKHRLHSRLISRNVAEHLSLSKEGACALVRRCFDWFGENRFTPPSLYVPPAWAMGALSRDMLNTLPFRYYESSAGVYDAHTGRFNPMPLAGFEADTHARATFLRIFNAVNVAAARLTGCPLRIAIHPYDADLHLARDLDRLLDRIPRFAGYAESLDRTAATPRAA